MPSCFDISDTVIFSLKRLVIFMGSIKPHVYFNFNHQLLPSLNICADNLRMNKIGLKIKAALTSKGLTQMSLAEKVGVSNNAVTKWIKTGKVAKDNIPKIAKILDMSSISNRCTASAFASARMHLDSGVCVTDNVVSTPIDWQ